MAWWFIPFKREAVRLLLVAGPELMVGHETSLGKNGQDRYGFISPYMKIGWVSRILYTTAIMKKLHDMILRIVP